jgi:hypothetical protein
MLAGDVVLAWPILFTILAYLGLLTNGLSHGFHPQDAPAQDSWNSVPIDSLLQQPTGRQLATLRRFFEGATFLFRTIPSLNSEQCRVPPSPPAIRDMKKPRQRKFAGASDSETLLA